MACMRRCKITLVAFVWLFYTVCFQRCPQITWVSTGIFTLAAFVHCALLNVSSNGLPERMNNHIGYICLVFLHCAFLNMSSNGLLKRMHSRTGCICLTLRLHERMQSHIGYICSTLLHCASSNGSSHSLHRRMHTQTGCICLAFLRCGFSNVSSSCLLERM